MGKKEKKNEWEQGKILIFTVLNKMNILAKIEMKKRHEKGKF